MSNTFDKLSVLDSFIEEVNSYLPEIETNLERLAQSPGDMDALEETYRRTHTIGGSASMMDFPGLAHVAHGMEDILGDALDGLITLDGSALGLLHRSLGRLRQLLEGIRSGIDEEPIVAEDDADFSRYRAAAEAAASPSIASPGLEETSIPYNGSLQAQSTQPVFEAPSGLSSPSPVPSAFPSFDEVLASFRTPSVTSGEEVAWPEDPFVARLENGTASQQDDSAFPEAPVALSDETAYQTSIRGRPLPPVPSAEPVQSIVNGQSALEELMASARRSAPLGEPEPVAPSVPESPLAPGSSDPAIAEEPVYYAPQNHQVALEPYH